MERVEELDADTKQNITEEQNKKLYAVDTGISTAILMTEQKIPTYETSWWSEELHQAHKIVKCWRRRVYYLWKNINNKEEELKWMEDAIGANVDVYQGNKNRKVNGQLWLAIKNRRCIKK
eukprot:1734362-Ditylum_brightwellii.AAC.1